MVDCWGILILNTGDGFYVQGLQIQNAMVKNVHYSSGQNPESTTGS
jgi:hypothetical protein